MIRICRTRPLVYLARLCVLRCLAVVGAVLVYLLGLCTCSSGLDWKQVILGYSAKEEGHKIRAGPDHR